MTSATSAKSLSFFVPVYNEKESLSKFIENVTSHLDEIIEDYEVIIVNDGSNDGTGELADELASKDPKVRVVHHEKNMNYGKALATGFKSATKGLIFYTDVDMPGDMDRLKEAIELIKDADLVIGYRVGKREKFRRMLYSYVYNRIIRMLFRVKVKDINFSFKLIRKAAMDRIELKSWTVFVDGELLIKATRNGCRIIEIPVTFKPREIGYSKFDSLTTAFQTLWEILRFFIGRQ